MSSAVTTNRVESVDYIVSHDTAYLRCGIGPEAATQPPPQRIARSLVLCFDGTGDSFDQDNTNVVKLFSALKKGDPYQAVYYQPGIGTIDEQGRQSSRSLGSILDMMFGTSIDSHIMSGYRFLMQRYQDGDRMSIFGFSRGAYTARALAAMIHMVGILPAFNDEQIHAAFMIYKQSVKGIENLEIAQGFKKTFSIDVQVHFVGVWDTVSSIGLIPRSLPGTKADHDIRYFRHALALDEHRGKFRQRNWVERKEAKSWKFKPQTQAQEEAERDTNGVLDKKKPAAAVAPQNLEVWFAGTHADVGGGSTRDTMKHSLSRISLRWMIRQCFICETRLLFKVESLVEFGFARPELLPLSHLPPKPHTQLIRQLEYAETTYNKILVDMGLESFRGPAAEALAVPIVSGTHDELADLVDAMTPVHDEMKRFNFWWLLEFWPIPKKIKIFGREVKIWVPNLGRFRVTKERRPKVHWTVKLRESSPTLGYKNLVKLEHKGAQRRGWGVVN